MFDRLLVPDAPIVRADAASALAAAAGAAAASPRVAAADAAALRAAAATGVFGARALAALERALVAGGARAGAVRELVAADEAARAAASGTQTADSRAAADAARAARRVTARVRAEHRDYDALARSVGGGAAARAESALAGPAAGLFGAAGGAALGGGLVIAIASASLFGFYVGGSIWGRGSPNVRGRFRVGVTLGGESHPPPPLQQSYAAAAVAAMATLMLEGVLLVLRLSRSEKMSRVRPRASGAPAAPAPRLPPDTGASRAQRSVSARLVERLVAPLPAPDAARLVEGLVAPAPVLDAGASIESPRTDPRPLLSMSDGEESAHGDPNASGGGLRQRRPNWAPA